jgi:CheY-like chemotaxis protein
MKSILIVEDDANIVEIYRESLLREGFEVRIAEDGLVAIKSLHDAKPDLVILDMIMPKFNGADVLKFIRSNPDLKHIKVIMFSNSFMTETAFKAEKLGADAFLLKLTFTPEQLINVVKTLLSGGHADEEHLKL